MLHHHHHPSYYYYYCYYTMLPICPPYCSSLFIAIDSNYMAAVLPRAVQPVVPPHSEWKHEVMVMMIVM